MMFQIKLSLDECKVFVNNFNIIWKIKNLLQSPKTKHGSIRK